MKWLRKVATDEAFGEWLRHEYQNRSNMKAFIESNYPRYVQAIVNPDFGNSRENEIRFGILLQIRQWVPSIKSADWWVAEYDITDLATFKLINSGDWRFLSGGTLNAIHTATNLENDPAHRRGVHGAQVNSILDNSEKLAKTTSKVTIMADSRTGPFTVVDGVHRTVAAALHYKVRRAEAFPTKEAYFGLVSSPFNLRFN